MKFIRYLVGFSALVVTVGIALFLVNNQDAVSAALAQVTATPARTRTPGPPVGISPFPYPTLSQHLDTEGLALTRALSIDSNTAIWRSTPWSLDTLLSEPGRIIIKWYSDRTYDGSSYAPDAETGPVWVITIKGDARFKLLGIGFDPRKVYNEVTYIIGQNTGDLLGVRLGPPNSSQPFLPTATIPVFQLPPAGTPVALTSAACTQNASGLSLRVTQQPGKSNIPGAGGPIYSFLVEGKGFTLGERVVVVIQGRATVPGSIGNTVETVGTDSTFATSIGAAVTQPNTPIDLFIVHRRGIACATVTVKP